MSEILKTTLCISQQLNLKSLLEQIPEMLQLLSGSRVMTLRQSSQALCHVVESTTPAVEVRFRNIYPVDELQERLLRLGDTYNVSHLDLSNVLRLLEYYVDPQTPMASIVNILPENGLPVYGLRYRALRSLSLAHNFLMPKVGVALGEALRSNSALLSLNLQYNKLGSEGACAVLSALCHNSSLQKLDLAHNEIYCDGSVPLKDALSKNSSLRALDLSNNLIHFEHITDHWKGLRNISLQVLSLQNNEVDDENAICLMKALKHNTSLQMLDLRDYCWNRPQGVQDEATNLQTATRRVLVNYKDSCD